LSPERIGVFGGGFNPVHVGHLIVAEEIRTAFNLEKIIFIPTAVPPHKTTANLASFKDRFRMIELAIEDNPYFDVDDIESRLKGKSFTVRTLRNLKEQNPDWDIYFLLGLDNLLEIGTWKEPDSILELASVVVFDRPGYKREGIDKRIVSRVLSADVTVFGVSA
jgi:nicotinate-nucleotide adenylyltransferase